jgi:hypothetical protein
MSETYMDREQDKTQILTVPAGFVLKPPRLVSAAKASPPPPTRSQHYHRIADVSDDGVVRTTGEPDLCWFPAPLDDTIIMRRRTSEYRRAGSRTRPY